MTWNRITGDPRSATAQEIKLRIDDPNGPDPATVRELDNARIEIQRLRGKLERLRGAMCYPASGVDQHWVYVSARVWHEVMGDIER